MLKFIRTQPIYLILLPVFFVIHACTEYWLFISAGEIALLLLRYIITGMVIFLVCLLIYRNKHKAGIVTFLLLLIYFFFAAFHQFLKHYSPVLLFSKYTFLIPFLLVVLIYLAVRIYRNAGSLLKTTHYINTLFLILLLTDSGILIYRAINPHAFNLVSITNKIEPVACTTCAKPDVYFLLFDEYASSLSLKEDYGYDNSQLDTFLINHGFTIQTQSKANYNWTDFSMASMVNMSYLQIPKPQSLSFADYVQADRLINQNQLASFFVNQGYEIESYSIFKFGGHKALFENTFTPVTSLITDRTFENHILKDVGWNFASTPDADKKRKRYDEHFGEIQRSIDLIKKAAATKSDKPRFIYGHLLLPHSPFYMNKLERETDMQKLEFDRYNFTVTSYLNYVYYTNTVIRDLCTSIQQNTGGKAIIIVMGDHGFRKPVDHPYPSHYRNLNAIYFGGKAIPAIYDSITAVNQFRVILNSAFNQTIPLLPDSCIYLKDE